MKLIVLIMVLFGVANQAVAENATTKQVIPTSQNPLDPTNVAYAGLSGNDILLFDSKAGATYENVYIVDPGSEQVVNTITMPLREQILKVEAQPGGDLLAILTNHALRLYSKKTGQFLVPLSNRVGGHLSVVAWSPSGKRLLFSKDAKKLQVFGVETASVTDAASVWSSPIEDAVWSPSEQYVAYVNGSNSIYLASAATGVWSDAPALKQAYLDIYDRVTWPAQNRLVGTSNGSDYVWDVTSRQVVTTRFNDGSVASAANEFTVPGARIPVIDPGTQNFTDRYVQQVGQDLFVHEHSEDYVVADKQGHVKLNIVTSAADKNMWTGVRSVYFYKQGGSLKVVRSNGTIVSYSL